MSLVFLGIIAFIQSMAFCWAGRSGNSGSPFYHFIASVGSNSTWFICSFFLILPRMLEIAETGTFLDKVITLFVYAICSSLGASVMMALLLKKEKGNKRVGAYNGDK